MCWGVGTQLETGGQPANHESAIAQPKTPIEVATCRRRNNVTQTHRNAMPRKVTPTGCDGHSPRAGRDAPCGVYRDVRWDADSQRSCRRRDHGRTIRRFCHGPVHARHLIPKKPCNSPRQMLQLDQIGTHRLVPRRTLRNSILLIWRVQENLRRDSLWDAGGVALLTQADFGSHCRTSQQRRPVGGCQNRARPLQAAPSLGK